MMNQKGAKDISVVVCTLNTQDTIVECLRSLKEEHPLEIILVDGRSKDKTVQFAAPYASRILYDEGKGLGAARNVGLEAASGTYVVFVGPDNIMPPHSLEQLKLYLLTYRYSIVCPRTLLKDTSSYLGWAQNRYREKNTPGERSVVGTPLFGVTRTLGAYKFDPEMRSSDDTDICERMAQDKHRFAFAPTICYEIGSTDMSCIRTRWNMYGEGDYLMYRKYAGEWNLKRKLQSFLHPFYTSVILSVKKQGPFHSIPLFPFLCIITGIRYYGWISAAIRR